MIRHVIATGALLALISGTAYAQSPPQLPACSPLLRAGLAPYQLPPSLVWEPVLGRVAAGLSAAIAADSLDSSARGVAVAAARNAANRAQAARAAGSPANESESDVAEAIVEARDDLIRSLPPAVFDALDAEAQAGTSPRNYRVPGHYVRRGNTTRCEGGANLKTHMYLVPEGALWEFYFHWRAVGAADSRLPVGGFDPQYVTGIGRGLKIPAPFIATVLQASVDADARVSMLRAADASDRDIARDVMRARTDLLRMLPRTVWLAVVADTRRIGGVHSLPTQ